MQLSDYFNRVKAIVESHADEDPKSGLRELLQEATSAFQSDPLYKTDLRYLKLWLLYIRQLTRAEGLATFASLLVNGIGASYSVLYEEYATILELDGRNIEAETVYRKGIKRQVRPLERLKIRYREFKSRLASTDPDRTPTQIAGGVSVASSSSIVTNASLATTAESRYAHIFAPPLPGKRPEKPQFDLSLLFSDKEYCIEEARARSIGLYGKKWPAPEPPAPISNVLYSTVSSPSSSTPSSVDLGSASSPASSHLVPTVPPDFSDPAPESPPQRLEPPRPEPPAIIQAHAPAIPGPYWLIPEPTPLAAASYQFTFVFPESAPSTTGGEGPLPPSSTLPRKLARRKRENLPPPKKRKLPADEESPSKRQRGANKETGESIWSPVVQGSGTYNRRTAIQARNAWVNEHHSWIVGEERRLSCFETRLQDLTGGGFIAGGLTRIVCRQAHIDVGSLAASLAGIVQTAGSRKVETGRVERIRVVKVAFIHCQGTKKPMLYGRLQGGTNFDSIVYEAWPMNEDELIAHIQASATCGANVMFMVNPGTVIGNKQGEFQTLLAESIKGGRTVLVFAGHAEPHAVTYMPPQDDRSFILMIEDGADGLRRQDKRVIEAKPKQPRRKPLVTIPRVDVEENRIMSDLHSLVETIGGVDFSGGSNAQYLL
ncbi:Mad3/BUB1 homology region 1-domain-containing protein [Mycena polygramma]|nr:Mad3/BUB1 homology region 1-domain-containing protein [Mycena polygramma]